MTVVTTSDCNASLDITASGSTSIYFDVHEGSVAVRNGAGPVSVEGNVVDIDLVDLSGPANVKVKVGDIKWTSFVSLPRQFDMRTSVGNVRYRIDGDELKRDQAPGAGDKLGIPGRRETAVSLRSGVGTIIVDLHSVPLKTN